jgi:hypothetical protein
MRTIGSLRRTATLLGAITIGAGALAAACSTATPSTAPNGGTPGLGRLELQPDVVVLQSADGASPVLSSDGLTWTFKAGSPGLDRLAAGKIVMAGDATGRVRWIETTPAGDTEVMLDPAALGEIIKNGELSSGDSPIPLVDPRFVIAPDLPGTVGPGDADISMGIPGMALVASRSPKPASPKPPPQVPTVHLGAGGDFTPFCCDPGVGAHVHYDHNGVRLTALMYYKLASPTVTYHALIKDGQMVLGELTVKGLKGIHLDLDATDHELVQNVDETYLIPVEFKVPVGGTVIDQASGLAIEGLSLSVLQMWDIRTTFSARTGSLLGTADYDFDSDALQVLFDQGSEGLNYAPGKVTVKTSLLDTMTGVSPGVARVQLILTVRWCLCDGALTGEDGLFTQLTSSFTATNDSSAVALLRKTHCRGVRFQLLTRAGLGNYLFPGLTEALNKERAAAGQSPLPAQAGRISPSVVRIDGAITDPPGMTKCQ